MADISMKMNKGKKSERYKGSLNISSEDMSEVKDWDIGDKVTVEVDIEVTELRKADEFDIEEYGMKENSVKANTDITAIKPVKSE